MLEVYSRSREFLWDEMWYADVFLSSVTHKRIKNILDLTILSYLVTTSLQV